MFFSLACSGKAGCDITNATGDGPFCQGWGWGLFCAFHVKATSRKAPLFKEKAAARQAWVSLEAMPCMNLVNLN